MASKKPIVIDDRRCICKQCKHANICEYYTKYQKLLDTYENLGSGDYLIKMISYIKKCNMFLEDK